MALYFMYGKYSPAALEGISQERTRKAYDAIAKLGGKVISGYAFLGKYDIALITSFPALADVMKASIALHKMTGISFTSFPAMTIEEFDAIK